MNRYIRNPSTRRVAIVVCMALVASLFALGTATAFAGTPAESQYGTFKPPTASKPKPTKSGPSSPTQPAEESTKPATSSTSTPSSSDGLPFTGLALWVPLVLGLLVIATGLTLRTRARRRSSTP